jgi:PTH1 family peptidyl-tRNA hydrolase
MAVFLGNPGAEYAKNRHNAGRMAARRLPFSPEWKKKFKGLYAGVNVGNSTVQFLQPETYMNLSGESAAAAAGFFKIDAQAIIVVHDELELPLGTLSLKFDGGLGGHNGLRSMKACLGTAAFWRLRIGIDRPAGDDVSGWVLSDFPASDEPLLELALTNAAGLLVKAFVSEPETLLSEWKKKRISLDEKADKV